MDEHTNKQMNRWSPNNYPHEKFFFKSIELKIHIFRKLLLYINFKGEIELSNLQYCKSSNPTISANSKSTWLSDFARNKTK